MSTSRSRSETALSLGCVGCSECRPYLLSVHHVNRDRSDNRQRNLECVCARCHGVRHLRQDDRRWVADSKCLTPRLVVGCLDKETRMLAERETPAGVPARLQAVNSLRLYYLTNLAEDPHNGSDWDLHVLDALDSLDLLASPRGSDEYDVEDTFG